VRPENFSYPQDKRERLSAKEAEARPVGSRNRERKGRKGGGSRSHRRAYVKRKAVITKACDGPSSFGTGEPQGTILQNSPKLKVKKEGIPTAFSDTRKQCKLCPTRETMKSSNREKFQKNLLKWQGRRDKAFLSLVATTLGEGGGRRPNGLIDQRGG